VLYRAVEDGSTLGTLRTAFAGVSESDTSGLIIVTLVARRPEKVEALPTPTLGDAT